MSEPNVQPSAPFTLRGGWPFSSRGRSGASGGFRGSVRRFIQHPRGLTLVRARRRRLNFLPARRECPWPLLPWPGRGTQILDPVFTIRLPPRRVLRGHFRFAHERAAAPVLIVRHVHGDLFKPPATKNKPRANRQFRELHRSTFSFLVIATAALPIFIRRGRRRGSGESWDNPKTFRPHSHLS